MKETKKNVLKTENQPSDNRDKRMTENFKTRNRNRKPYKGNSQNRKFGRVKSTKKKKNKQAY